MRVNTVNSIVSIKEFDLRLCTQCPQKYIKYVKRFEVCSKVLRNFIVMQNIAESKQYLNLMYNTDESHLKMLTRL